MGMGHIQQVDINFLFIIFRYQTHVNVDVFIFIIKSIFESLKLEFKLKACNSELWIRIYENSITETYFIKTTQLT